MSPIKRAIDRAIAAITARLRSMVQRVVLSSLADSGGIQIVTVKGLGPHVRKAEHMQPAGLTSRPTAGEGVAVAVNGNTDHLVVLGMANRSHRPTDLAAGDTAIYDEHDGEIHMSATGIELHQGGATDFVALAQLVLDELNDIRTDFDTHIHTTTATVGVGPAGVISIPTALMGPASSVAASKVKAE